MRNPLAVSILCNLLLIVALFSCTAGFLHGIDKQQDINDRAELTRCQEGYTAACKQWQKIASNYQPHNSMEDSRGN